MSDGEERQVVPIGDPGAPITIRFVRDGCPYIVELPGAEYGDDREVVTPGYTNEEAVEYAARL